MVQGELHTKVASTLAVPSNDTERRKWKGEEEEGEEG